MYFVASNVQIRVTQKRNNCVGPADINGHISAIKFIKHVEKV